MMPAVALVGLVMVWLGVRLIQRAAQGYPVVAEVLHMRARPIQAIAAGPVELEGTITAEAPITGLSNVRCVAALTTIRSAAVQGKSNRRKLLGEQRRLAVAAATLRDGSGACALDLEHSDIVGDGFSGTFMPIDLFIKDAPAWAHALVAEGATHVSATEQIIPMGARVLVAGRATALAPPGEEGEGGAAPRFQIAGSSEEPLLLGFGGQRRLALRAMGPVAFGVAAGVYLCAFGIVAFAVAVSG